MTRRFVQMVAWYRDVFEADVVYENPALAFLTYDDEHHRFAFANLDLLKPGGTSADNRGNCPRSGNDELANQSRA